MAGLALETSIVGRGKTLAKVECMVASSSNEHPATVMRPGTVDPGTLSATSYPFFCYSIIAGLVPPFSSFFLVVLDHYQIQPLHLSPDSFLIISVFAFYCEGFLGIKPSVALLHCFFNLNEVAGDCLAGCVCFDVCPDMEAWFPEPDVPREMGSF